MREYTEAELEQAKVRLKPMGTRTGRLSQIPGRPDLVKTPFIPPKGSIVYWDESGELMLKMPEKEEN